MQRMSHDEETIKVTVRLPVCLHESLVQAARRERRSLNSQVVIDLERLYALRGDGATAGGSTEAD